jgi:CRP-like cAMP-binding protein
MDVRDTIWEFFSKYPKHTYPKGQILVFAGEDPEHIFYLVKGRVRQYDLTYRGDEVAVNIFKPPAFFPMSWAINRTQNQFFFKTEVETEAHVVPPDDAVEFLKANPDVTFDLLSRVYRGTDGILGRMVHLMSGTARSRLLYELIIECRRIGEKHQNGMCTLTLNETDLAARSGLSRETVSREIRHMKAEGWIEITGQKIIVTHIEQLEGSLGGSV